MKKIIFIVIIIWETFFLSCKQNTADYEINMTIELDSVKSILMYSAEAYASIHKIPDPTSIKSGFCWNINPSPKIKDSYLNAKESLNINSIISNLMPNNTYYIRAFAILNTDTVYSNEIVFKTWDGKLIDYDGNEYNGVQIGNQGWMSQNLKSKHYSDGTIIDTWCSPNQIHIYGEGSNIIKNPEADLDSDGDIDNSDGIIYIEKYGLLYTWYSANNIYSSSCNGWIDKKVAENSCDICPDGWHLPSENEWYQLEQFLIAKHSYDSVAIVLKSKQSWLNNANGIDLYGLNLKPAGLWMHDDYYYYDFYYRLGEKSLFWTSTEGNSENGIAMEMNYNDKSVNDAFIGKDLHGISVRCVKNR